MSKVLYRTVTYGAVRLGTTAYCKMGRVYE